MNTTTLQALEDRAVDCAIQGDWEKAVSTNSEILKKSKHNIPTLLRLGFAYLKLSKYPQALTAYRQVLKLQPQNAIAGEYVEKIELRKKNASTPSISTVTLDSNLFIELPGKTKTVALSQLGQKSVLAKLMVGELVYVSVRKHHVEVRTQADEYIGVLPDDVGVRLMYFLENGSEYTVHVQEAALGNVIVFIREIVKGKKVEKLVSFPIDIPASISKVMAYQNQQKEIDQSQEKVGTVDVKPAPKDLEDDEDSEIDDEKDEDVLENELLKDLEGDHKQEAEILGIDTEEEDEEE